MTGYGESKKGKGGPEYSREIQTGVLQLLTTAYSISFKTPIPQTQTTTMESLLSPSESHAFQSFLSSMSHDWNVVDHIQVPNDKLALARATKDLMALDPHNWLSNQPHQQDLFLPFLNTRLPNSQQLSSHLLLPHPPSDSSSRTPTPTSASPFTFPSSHISRSSDSSLGKQTKRPRPSHPHPYDVSDSLSHSISRIRRSHSDSIQSTSPSSSTPSPPSSKPPPKPALLTPSQKKANHIQSEQKRRANIRRGYDALCDCVPALREAIREEEEAAAAERSDSTGVPGQLAKVRKGKPAIRGKDGDERIDGRAGPRSENIVLSKSKS